MINTIILGHALNELPKLPAESINCVTCSPPYWGLRDYGIEPVIWDGDKDCRHEWGNNLLPRGQSGWHTFEHKYHNSGSHKTTLGSKLKKEPEKQLGHGQFCSKCGAWRGSLGLEPTFELYIKHLCDIFDEVKRVLRKDGTCWVNLGDSYSGSNCGSNDYRGRPQDKKYKGQKPGKTNLPSKSLCLIPQRFVIEMVNRGWILRNTIIWHKKNCMPSSAKDRFTVDFEYVYFFVKSKRYFFEQQFEASIDPESYTGRRKRNAGTMAKYDKKNYLMAGSIQKNGTLKYGQKYPNRNKRAVWTIPTQPFPEAHFAVYPEKLIEPMIEAGCPRYVCKKCGKARVKIYEVSKMPEWDKTHKNNAIYKLGKTSALEIGGPRYNKWKEKNPDKFIGYTDCNCNAGFEGGIVIDPFMGAGTTALVALTQRKRFIGIEIKQEYIDMAYKRIARVQQGIF